MKTLTRYQPAQALAVMLVYLVVFIFNTFLLPNLNTGAGNNHNCFLKKRAETYVNLQRTDKTVITKTSSTTVKTNAASFILLFTVANLPPAKQVIVCPSVQLPLNHRPIYLSNRVIRI